MYDVNFSDDIILLAVKCVEYRFDVAVLLEYKFVDVAVLLISKVVLVVGTITFVDDDIIFDVDVTLFDESV